MTRKIILVVGEDDSTTQPLKREFGTQYQFLGATHGKRAIELAEKNGIVLAIVSQYLPDMDSLELLKSLKHRFPSIPLIFVAEVPTKKCIISAFRSGAKDLLEKPFDEHILMETVHRVLNSNPKDQDSFAHKVEYPPRDSLQKLLLNLLRNRIIPNSYWFRPFVGILKLIILNLPIEQAEPEEAKNFKDMGTAEKNLPLRLEIKCFGRFQVVLNNHVIDHWSSRRGRAIFAYLAYHHKRRINREILMDKFWPDSSPESARNCLNVALHSIRQLFHKIDPIHEYVLFRDECYFINPEVEVWLDVAEFLSHWRKARSLEHEQGIEAAVGEYELATANYRGDFLEEDLYEGWATLERENLREVYLLVLDRLSRHYSLDGKSDMAIELCESILEKDNCREDVHRRLMQCYYRIGQRDKALRQFRKCAEILKEELEVGPTRETGRLYEQIKHDSLIP